MSVIAEFTVPSDDFTIGAALQSAKMEVRLERIVPVQTGILPFIWASGGDFGTFEEIVTANTNVRSLNELADIDHTRLYQLDWEMGGENFVSALLDANAVVLDSKGDAAEWYFQLLFPEHPDLGDFYRAVSQRGIKLDTARVYVLTEDFSPDPDARLTPEQREALQMAVKRGHFDTPSQVTLAELAEDFGITPQAFSQRVRRANEKILRHTLDDPEGNRDSEGTR